MPVMRIFKKILKCPVWVVTLILFSIAYCASEWYAHVMFLRWAESDGTDAEAYAVVNHSGASSFEFFLVAAVIVLAFWILKKYNSYNT